MEKARQEFVWHLKALKRRYNDTIFQVVQKVKKLTADLMRLQNKDKEYSRKNSERNGWFAFLALPIYGKKRETNDKKMAKEIERIQRVAIKRIKASKLKEIEMKLNRFQDKLRNTKDKIVLEIKKVKKALQKRIREEKLRKAHKAKMKAEQKTYKR